MATALISHGLKQVAMGWHCYSKLPLCSEWVWEVWTSSPHAKGEEMWWSGTPCFSCCSESAFPGKGLQAVDPVPWQHIISALLLSEVLSVLSRSFYLHPLLLFYFIVFTAENCPGKFNDWTSEAAVTAKQLMYLYSQGWGFLDRAALSSETAQGRYSHAFKTLFSKALALEFHFHQIFINVQYEGSTLKTQLLIVLSPTKALVLSQSWSMCCWLWKTHLCLYYCWH